eukprot:GHUV01037958.1.p1 GENE.GHUV01037958.1~~GHUV01037958.1.p1  ORF type:complete len:106 (+),score=9.00 GHUV01037958.1:455-772(+)
MRHMVSLTQRKHLTGYHLLAVTLCASRTTRRPAAAVHPCGPNHSYLQSVPCMQNQMCHLPPQSILCTLISFSFTLTGPNAAAGFTGLSIRATAAAADAAPCAREM